MKEINKNKPYYSARSMAISAPGADFSEISLCQLPEQEEHPFAGAEVGALLGGAKFSVTKGHQEELSADEHDDHKINIVDYVTENKVKLFTPELPRKGDEQVRNCSTNCALLKTHHSIAKLHHKVVDVSKRVCVCGCRKSDGFKTAIYHRRCQSFSAFAMPFTKEQFGVTDIDDSDISTKIV